MKGLKLLFLIFLSISFTACWLSSEKRVESQKEEEVSILRYDKLLNEYVRSNSFSALQKMNMKYRQPTKILIEDVLSLGLVGDDTISQKLRTFYSDSTLLQLMSDVEKKFANLDELEKALTKGFNKLTKELPGTRVPFVYAQISALNESVVLTDSLLGISLDKYMGEDYPLYKRFYYDYQRRTMRPEQIVTDCFVYYLMGNYPFPAERGVNLLNVMLHQGKINYVVQKLLDDKNMFNILGYSPEEQAWCKANEHHVWEYMLKNRHLEARDPMLIRQYMKLSPVTVLFGEGAPPLIGTWIGARIISEYMKKHKEVSLEELLNMIDYKKILEESNYLD